ncbi:hypothetical protein Tco_1418997 [Tanacetum coccineum]
MWNAIKSRFGGNDESKKMQKYILKQQFEGFTVSNTDGIHKGYERFQSLLSQLEIHGAGVSTEDANQKFLRSLTFCLVTSFLNYEEQTRNGQSQPVDESEPEAIGLKMPSGNDLHENTRSSTRKDDENFSSMASNSSGQTHRKFNLSWSDAPIIEEYESDRENVKNQSTHSQKPKVNNKELGQGFTKRACFDNPHRTLKNKGIIDSGCSRHMTGNKAYLADFKTLMVAPVAVWRYLFEAPTLTLSPRPFPDAQTPLPYCSKISIPEPTGVQIKPNKDSQEDLLQRNSRMPIRVCIQTRENIAERKSLGSKNPLFDDIFLKITLSTLKQKNAQREGGQEKLVDKDKDIDEVMTYTKMRVSTDKERVSTDKQVEGTEEHNEGSKEIFEGTEEQREGTEEKVESTLANKIKGVELKMLRELIDQATSQRITSSHDSLFQRFDLKTKGRRRLKRRMNLETVKMSDLPSSCEEIKQLESDESWQRKARIEADGILAEKLQEQEREQFTIEERAKFLHDTIAAQRKFLAQQRLEAIRNRPPTKNQLRNQMMTNLKQWVNFKHSGGKSKKIETYKLCMKRYKIPPKKKRSSRNLKKKSRKRIKEKRIQERESTNGGEGLDYEIHDKNIHQYDEED